MNCELIRKKKRKKKHKQKKVFLQLKIKTIKDIIEFENTLDYEKTYYFDKIKLKKIIPALKKIDELTGMLSIKNSLVQQILFCLQDLYSDTDNFNTIVYGCPGTGKTTVSLLIAELYFSLGLVKSSTIYNINKNDLVGQFCGSTVQKTQELLDKVDNEGAVLFIDEVYSLGFGEKTDLFSKECIDVICKNLLLKNNMITIISGYKDDIKTNFLDINQGLSRRFSYKYEIENYTKSELLGIFKNKLNTLNIKINIKILSKIFPFFKKVDFTNNGGDIDILVQLTKIQFAKRVFGNYRQNESFIEDVDIIEALGFFGKKEKNTYFDYFI